MASCCSGIKEDYLWWCPSLVAILFLACSVWWRMIFSGCTDVYSPVERRYKEIFWEELDSIRGMWNGPRESVTKSGQDLLISGLN